MFCECPDVKIFWKDVIMWWNTKRPDNINPNSIEILYGYKPGITSFFALNLYLLIAKYHVYLARNQSETPGLQVFLVLLESKIKCERQMKRQKKSTELSGPLSASAMREHLIFMSSNEIKPTVCL